MTRSKANRKLDTAADAQAVEALRSCFQSADEDKLTPSHMLKNCVAEAWGIPPEKISPRRLGRLVRLAFDDPLYPVRPIKAWHGYERVAAWQGIESRQYERTLFGLTKRKPPLQESQRRVAL